MLEVTCESCGAKAKRKECCDFHKNEFYRKFHKPGCAYQKATKDGLKMDGRMFPRCDGQNIDYYDTVVSMDYVAAHGIPLEAKVVS